MDNETKSLIHLNLMQGISGSNTVQKLVEIYGSAEEALKASSEEIENKMNGVDEVTPAGLITRLLHYPLEKELELINKHGCHIITFYDEDYPELLKMIDRPPIVLYVKGELKPKDANCITIVGPRKARNFGKEFSHDLSYALAKQDVTVVSGLAKGIDTCAHRGALDAGGRTLAVMGRGLSRIYPRENNELANEIAKSGALISEFPMDVVPESHYFLIRNRIISGLAHGTVVVEAPSSSGSLRTAKYAKEQERNVFAVPSSINTEHSSGCYKLIKEGALHVDKVDDVLKALPQLSTTKTPDRSVKSNSEEPGLFEQSAFYHKENEEKVKSEVIEYFRSTFPGIYIKLEYEIVIANKNRRADIALINSDQKVQAVVECKSRGIAETQQIHDYLYASYGTNFGLFANTTNQAFWTFYRKTYNEKSTPIKRTEFEKGILKSIKGR